MEKDLKQVCADVQLLKHRLGELGLYESMQLMEEVTKKVGWEVASILVKEKGVV